ncbi:MAG: DUF262 domain-containing protein [Prevotellaceae bacterium]|jgi:uncharacterized protein with ParB-like and HNH nuclease domain|nr:DUF262 domain-containing protein [Prevotellaceae bacterium]
MSKLHVDQKSVKNILSEKSNQYLIPEYQRPYEWDKDKCRTLWDDILEFAMPDNNPDNFDSKEEYFLGSIVTFKDSDIFKAQLYKYYSSENKLLTDFVEFSKSFGIIVE